MLALFQLCNYAFAHVCRPISFFKKVEESVIGSTFPREFVRYLPVGILSHHLTKERPVAGGERPLAHESSKINPTHINIHFQRPAFRARAKLSISMSLEKEL